VLELLSPLKPTDLFKAGALSLCVVGIGLPAAEHYLSRGTIASEAAAQTKSATVPVTAFDPALLQAGLNAAGYNSFRAKTPTEIVAQTKPATVLITVFMPNKHGKPNKHIKPTKHGQLMGWGAGWFVDKDGNVVTANHVTSGAAKIFVTTAEGEKFPAELIGSDPKADVAVLRIHAGHATPYLPWGGYAGLRPGAEVIEIGNPLNMNFSASFGHVSALHRSLGDTINMVQYDAANNPGNSGGPVMDAQGRVIGLADMLVAPTARIGLAQFAGLAFAVPEDHVHKVVDDIIKHGKAMTGRLRITYEDATKPDKKFPVEQAGAGAVVLTVEAGGAADLSGLKKGDIIVSCGDTKITEKDDLAAILNLTHPGDPLRLTIMRRGEKREIELVLGGDLLPSNPLPPKPKALAAMAP
jgi:S1-C subfamily serine protease